MASSNPHIKNLILTQSHQINWNKNQFDDMNEAAFWNLFGGLPFSLNSIYFQPSLQVIPIFESTIESTDNGCWMLTISPHPTIHIGLSIFTKRWFCIHIKKPSSTPTHKFHTWVLHIFCIRSADKRSRTCDHRVVYEDLSYTVISPDNVHNSPSLSNFPRWQQK